VGLEVKWGFLQSTVQERVLLKVTKGMVYSHFINNKTKLQVFLFPKCINLAIATTFKLVSNVIFGTHNVTDI